MKYPSHKKFPGSVIDPTTHRLCATVSDIARGLRIFPAQLSNCLQHCRRYGPGGRYIDLDDALVARAKVPKRGRPRIHPVVTINKP